MHAGGQGSLKPHSLNIGFRYQNACMLLDRLIVILGLFINLFICVFLIIARSELHNCSSLNLFNHVQLHTSYELTNSV